MENVVFITGANSKYFLMACVLMHSLKRSIPNARFYVLDFGMSPMERKYLDTKSAIARIAGINAQTVHPYILKTRMITYIGNLPSWETAVWIDSDIFLADDFGKRFAELMKKMRKENYDAAAAPEATIQEIFDALPRLDFAPFRLELSSRNISTQLNYFNSGFIIFRSKEFLRQWEDLSNRILFHALYDQNVFNILAHSNFKTLPLDGEIWNLHGTKLDIDILDKILDNKVETPAVFHLTTHKPNCIDFGSCRLEGHDYEFRLFVNRKLREMQFQNLKEFISAELPALKQAGFME